MTITFSRDEIKLDSISTDEMLSSFRSVHQLLIVTLPIPNKTSTTVHKIVYQIGKSGNMHSNFIHYLRCHIEFLLIVTI